MKVVKLVNNCLSFLKIPVVVYEVPNKYNTVKEELYQKKLKELNERYLYTVKKVKEFEDKYGLN